MLPSRPWILAKVVWYILLCIDLKHYINDILNILNERNTTSTKNSNVSEQMLLLEEQVKILKFENKKLQEERKAQLNVTERLKETQNSDFRKETGNDWTTVQQEQQRFEE